MTYPMTSDKFFLPDGSVLFVDPGNSTFDCWIHPKTVISMIPFPVKELRVESWPSRPGSTLLRFINGNQCWNVDIDSRDPTPLLNWVSRTGTIIRDLRPQGQFQQFQAAQGAVPATLAPEFTDNFPVSTPTPPKTTCGICYGTGFYKGYGAPCSKGCKAP